jgi:hypothetical protein
VNTPLTANRDEWAEAFLNLAKLVVEGFETKVIRAKLDAAQITYNKEDKTIALLSQLLNKPEGEPAILTGMRTIQYVRTKAKGQASGSEGDQLIQDVLMKHETFARHFRHVRELVSNELGMIEILLSQDKA